jgi:PAS domain S-box-containing protein
MLPIEEIRALLQGTIDTLQDSIIIISPQYQILFMNGAAERRHQKSCHEASGKTCFDVLGGATGPCAHCTLRLVVETGHSQEIEFRANGFDGQVREYEQVHYPLKTDSGELLAVAEITRDVTERRLFERQLLHSEKLAVLGQLSTAVAHEIRNPLTGIRLGIDTLLEKDRAAEEKETLEAIVQDVRRLDHVLTQLLDFSRRKEAHRDRLSIAGLIERALFFIRKQAYNQHVTIKQHLKADLPEVKPNADQILQVFLNIFMNALQAMPEGGTVLIQTDRLSYASRPGVLITVQDTGKGIPEAHRERLFEMFFSTKPSGSGVGLAVSNEIIAEHGGAIWVESPPGAGASVNIFLPVDTQDQPE